MSCEVHLGSILDGGQQAARVGTGKAGDEAVEVNWDRRAAAGLPRRCSPRSGSVQREVRLRPPVAAPSHRLRRGNGRRADLNLVFQNQGRGVSLPYEDIPR